MCVWLRLLYSRTKRHFRVQLRTGVFYRRRRVEWYGCRRLLWYGNRLETSTNSYIFETCSCIFRHFRFPERCAERRAQRRADFEKCWKKLRWNPWWIFACKKFWCVYGTTVEGNTTNASCASDVYSTDSRKTDLITKAGEVVRTITRDKVAAMNFRSYYLLWTTDNGDHTCGFGRTMGCTLMHLLKPQVSCQVRTIMRGNDMMMMVMMFCLVTFMCVGLVVDDGVDKSSCSCTV